MNKLFLLLTFLIIVVGCKKEENTIKGLPLQNYKETDFQKLKTENQNITTLTIPPIDLYDEPFLMSEVLDTCYSVQLETNGDNLIGQIDGIIATDKYFFILDSEKSKGVFKFDSYGKYLGKIGNVGGGPGEYPFPEALEIDNKNNEVLVFNGTIRKIFRYSFDGEFLGEIPVELGCYDISLLENGNIVLFAGDYGNEHLNGIKNKIVYIINRQGEILSYGPNVSSDFENVKTILGSNYLVKNSSITYNHKFSDTIYSVDENSIIGKYHIDFGKDKLNREKLKSLDTDNFLASTRQTPTFSGSHFQTNNYLAFNFSYNNKVINCFYNKPQSKLLASTRMDFSNIDCLYSFTVRGSYRDFFITSIDAFNLSDSKSNISKIENQEWLDNNKQLIENLNKIEINETDNPVLVFFKLKDNI